MTRTSDERVSHSHAATILEPNPALTPNRSHSKHRIAHARVLRPALLALVLALGVLGGALPAFAGRIAMPEVPDGARGVGAHDRDVPRVEARLVVEHEAIAYDTPFRAGVLLDIAPGWHVYAGDGTAFGRPTTVTWKIEDAEVEAIRWPDALRYREETDDPAAPLLETRGYENQVLLATEMRVQQKLDGPVALQARVEFIACNTICIPGEITLARTLMLGAPREDDARSEAIAALFDDFPSQFEQAGATPPRTVALWQAFVMAMIGGLILNLMPCVLPVLALKVFSLAQMAGAHRSEAARHGVVYAAGVLVSMWLLAGFVLALRGAGMAVGWGFQFQHPVFLVGIALLLLLFAMNMIGVYEINPDTSRLAGFGASAQGLRRSFFDGFLAVALATPCSAPFLGTAVGFAFAGGAFEIVAVFSAIGLGLALPFVVIAFVPGWARLLPRSGVWMQHLRTVLGLALFATMLWVFWILGRSVDTQTQTKVLGLLAFAALGAWTLGAMQRRHASRTGWLGAGLVAFLAVGVALLPLEPGEAVAQSEPSAVAASLGGVDYDAEALAGVLRSGRPAFAYFTADWCITCKVNEQLVLGDEAIRNEIERLDIAVFRGDWTRRDEALRAALAGYGKAGVPTYVVHRPGRPDQPNVLPEVLTVDLLLAALREAAPESSGRSL